MRRHTIGYDKGTAKGKECSKSSGACLVLAGHPGTYHSITSIKSDVVPEYPKVYLVYPTTEVKDPCKIFVTSHERLEGKNTKSSTSIYLVY